MNPWNTLSDIRREYGELSLSELDTHESPIEQFKLWFEDVLKIEKSDPTAMLLSTVDENAHPDSRVVLLKGVLNDQFIFYTNYESTKSIQIHHNPYVALNFYWPQMARQIRIRGRATRVSEAQSDAYFASRPTTSQLSAIVSPQSREILGRDVLEQAINQLIEQYGQEPLLRPKHWGGYAVAPQAIEFWQGRDNRLHDRVHYYQENGKWAHHRLAP